jgi:hypothetical protein
VIKFEVRVDQLDAGVLRDIHDSMVDLWHRGFALPIRWTLASYKEPAAVVSGATSDGGDEIMTTTSDNAEVPSTFPLPAYLVATDAKGMSITGIVPSAGDQELRE